MPGDPPPTAGPLVDAIAEHWSQLGQLDGKAVGEAMGYNYGLATVFEEKSKHESEPGGYGEVPRVLQKPVPDNRRDRFSNILAPDADSYGPCLEQIWYDIGYESAKEEAYKSSVAAGQAAAYQFFLLTPKGSTDRVLQTPPPFHNP